MRSSKMTEQTWWLVGVGAVLAAAVIGFLLGRSKLGGANQRVDALEAEISRQKEELAGYKREVETHFDKTASLVASMAGSYRELFEHLSSGQEQLSSGAARQLVGDRAVGLLVGAPAADEAKDSLADTPEPPQPSPSNALDPEDLAPSSVAGQPEPGNVAAKANAATPESDTGIANASSPLPNELTPGDQSKPIADRQGSPVEKAGVTASSGR
ncbi:MAG TPA: hypothetical protein DHV85_22150 [Candidatus Accumulibacter sp.]|nr:hypothetical protein [Accumulibacter sp.]